MVTTARYRAGDYTKWVTLSRNPQTPSDPDGFFEDLSPAATWCRIAPVGGQNADRTLTHNVEMPFHDQVTIDTRLVYNGRELFVRSVQNVDEAYLVLRLVCEEIVR